MLRVDLVGDPRLLDGKLVVLGVLGHQAQAGVRRGAVVVLATVEVGLVAGAAVLPDGPEVVVGRGLRALQHHRRHTVNVAILEPHRLRKVQVGAPCESNTASVHDLLSSLPDRINTRIGVQICNFVVGLHVNGVVHGAQDHAQDPGDQERQKHEDVPRRLPGGVGGLLLPVRPVRSQPAGRGHDGEERHDVPGHAGVPVAHRERQQARYDGERQPRDEDRHHGSDPIHPLLHRRERSKGDTGWRRGGAVLPLLGRRGAICHLRGPRASAALGQSESFDTGVRAT
mmetsp:Transcript_50686/g.131782  ORF Transcript_50686/g.131782 Transcript_50686/m.131782 type:complete len:284 (+) Transcript_50686:211-1062(+)